MHCTGACSTDWNETKVRYMYMGNSLCIKFSDGTRVVHCKCKYVESWYIHFLLQQSFFVKFASKEVKYQDLGPYLHFLEVPCKILDETPPPTHTLSIPNLRA